MDTVEQIRKVYRYSGLDQSEFLKLVSEIIGIKPARQDSNIRLDSAERLEFTRVETEKGIVIVGIEK